MDEAEASDLAAEWDDTARRIIRVEMTRRRMSFADLAQALSRIKVVENERNLRNKVARGSFSAVFFLQCLVAMGVDGLELRDQIWPHAEVTRREIDPKNRRHPQHPNWKWSGTTDQSQDDADNE